MPSNKKVLLQEDDFSFFLTGIISSLKDYRLAHFINKTLGFALSRTTTNPAYKLKAGKVEGYISLFTDFDEESEVEIYFFSNRGSEGFIIPELKSLDHFMMIVPGTARMQLGLVDSLNTLERVEKALTIDVMGLKSKANLLFF